MQSNKMEYALGILRITFGLVFLWAFFDKTFGLGFATTADKSWLAGGSPTFGFLTHGTAGPFANFFQSLAGNGLVDWLFMLGLLFIGVSLTLGIMTKLAGLAGMLMYLLMYTAVGMHSENHPFIDDHFTGFFVMFLLKVSDSGKYLGLGKTWEMTSLVQKYRWLR